jgi:hypothetical protein
MVFNSIFNNISYSRGTQFYRVEETGVPGENHRPVASHRQTLSRNVIFTHKNVFLLPSIVIL